MKSMSRTRIKKIITKSGQVQWFLGDGLWFGRISAVKAEILLASEDCTLYAVEVK